MSIFQIENDKAAMVNPTKFGESGMTERDLQNVIKNNPNMLGEDLLIIGKELAPFANSKKRMDLLALDVDGNLVVIELKRDDDGFHMDLQAIRYASMARLFTITEIIEFYSKFHNCDSEKSKNDIDNFLGGDYAEKLNFDNVRIILINQDFSKEITNAVLWLNEQGLDIKCIKITQYEFKSEKLWDVDMIIPMKEAKDYQLSLREKKVSDQETIRQAKDKTKYSFNGKEGLGKGRLVLEVLKHHFEKNSNSTLDELNNKFPNHLQGTLNMVEFFDDIKDTNKQNRYFTKNDEILILPDNKIAVVCNQWGIGNIIGFIKHAESMGYQIKKTSQ